MKKEVSFENKDLIVISKIREKENKLNPKQNNKGVEIESIPQRKLTKWIFKNISKIDKTPASWIKKSKGKKPNGQYEE